MCWGARAAAGLTLILSAALGVGQPILPGWGRATPALLVGRGWGCRCGCGLIRHSQALDGQALSSPDEATQLILWHRHLAQIHVAEQGLQVAGRQVLQHHCWVSAWRVLQDGTEVLAAARHHQPMHLVELAPTHQCQVTVCLLQPGKGREEGEGLPL